MWFDRIFCYKPIHPLRLIKKMWFVRTFCIHFVNQKEPHPSFEANQKDVV